MKMQPNGVKQNIKTLFVYGNRKGESRTIQFDRNFRLQRNPMVEKITNRLTYSDQGKKTAPLKIKLRDLLFPEHSVVQNIEFFSFHKSHLFKEKIKGTT